MHEQSQRLIKIAIHCLWKIGHKIFSFLKRISPAVLLILHYICNYMYKQIFCIAKITCTELFLFIYLKEIHNCNSFNYPLYTIITFLCSDKIIYRFGFFFLPVCTWKEIHNYNMKGWKKYFWTMPENSSEWSTEHLNVRSYDFRGPNTDHTGLYIYVCFVFIT